LASKNLKDVLAAHVAAFNYDDLDVDQKKRLIPNSQVLEWMYENIPLVELPDRTIERAYYFRWWTFRKHLRQTEDACVISEFLADVPWAGKHNTINCAAGHHFYEGRWIKSPKYLDEYLRFWFEGGGSVRSYSFWVADAAYKRYLVTGDASPLKRHYDDFINNYKAWEESHSDESGLFWQVDDREGMEFSMAGTGLRPNINSYMYADARAIAAIARLLGDTEQAKVFDKKADSLQKLMQEILWDKEAKFFKTYVSEKHRKIQQENYKGDNAHLGQPLGLSPIPELFGYTPWYYGVMDKLPAENFLKAWRLIMDRDYFAGPVGLSTAPIKHPDFMRPHHHECAWDGPSWPFATCQALGAMARSLRNFGETKAMPVTADDFMKLIKQYAAAHRLVDSDGKDIDWIDENYDPFDGEWIARNRLYAWNDEKKDRGQYYNHSSFCDLIISDVIGLQCRESSIMVQPLALDWPHFRLDNVHVRGRKLSIRYRKEAGLKVLVDGQIAGELPKLGVLEISM